jgi:fused signal recognition particle receptor
MSVDEPRHGWFQRLKDGLGKTRQALATQIEDLFAKPPDEALYESLEESLLQSDVGIAMSEEIVDQMRQRVAAGAWRPDDLRSAFREILLARLGEPGDLRLEPLPAVVLVIGVNGSGKTTTIGKLASRLAGEGRRVLIAAGDTFRAAAIEQLEIWAGRAGVDVVRHQEGSDPAAVVFDAVQAARGRRADVLIVDTAGRLHTKVNLMEELRKVRRVIDREFPEATVESLLVLDANTGQNGLQQARQFKDAVQVTGIALTKLDSTAKGGVLLSVGRELGLPVKLIGVGERVEDLQPFDPVAFVDALFPADGAR